MAEATDAARERVLAAREGLATELDRLEASARAAADIPSKVRKSPAKAAAIAGGAGFLVLGGPRRLFKRVKTAITGPEPELPERMLPDDIEKALRKLGSDGDKVRGTIERDFADYVEQAQKKRGPAVQEVLLAALTGPVLQRGLKTAGKWFARIDQEGFSTQLDKLRMRQSAAGEPLSDEPVENATPRNRA